MATIDVKIPKSLYKQLDPKEYTKALQKGVNAGTKILQPEVEKYPPKRPNQKYIRTFRLRRSWRRTVKVRASVVEGRIYSDENQAPYNAYVKHPRLQAWMHRGRWPTTEDDARAKKRDVMREVEREIKRIASSK